MHRLTNSLRTTAIAAMLIGAAGQAMADDPVFFTWWLQVDTVNGVAAPRYPASGTAGQYTYCPQPGGFHGWGLGIPQYTYMNETWDDMASDGLPIALLLRERNSPWGSCPTWDLYDSTYPSYGAPYAPDPAQLAHGIVDRALEDSQIDYVLCDIETRSTAHYTITNSEIDAWLSNVQDMVNPGLITTPACTLGVTGDPRNTGSSVNIAQSEINAWDTVYVGNYGTHRYPVIDLSSNPAVIGGSNTYTNVTAIWENQAQSLGLANQHNRYVDNKLNTIMPVTYANCAQVRHVDQDPFSSAGDHWSGEHSPNVRAAYIWCGIEKFSSAVREEIAANGSMDNTKAIPWVTPLTGLQDPQGSTYGGCWMPPSADFLATIQHLRLRGADGFYFWSDSTSSLSPTSTIAVNHWSATDGMGNHLNPWYDASEQWADSTASLNGYDWFTKNALLAWEEFDGDFDGDSVPYRLDTDKESGIVVSAMNDMGRLSILISYMKTLPGGAGTTVSVDNYFTAARDYSSGSAVSTVSIGQDYVHKYEQDFFTPDVNGDGLANVTDQGLWFGLYLDADTRADWNRDGSVNTADLTLYNAAYADFNS